MIEISLIVIICLVLILPMAVHFVEKNLELFLFLMGILAVSFSHWWGSEPVWSRSLLKEVLTEPMMITAAVMTVGVALYFLRNYVFRFIVSAERVFGKKVFIFMVITGLGIVSSIITAIMAALLLVEVISILRYSSKIEIRLIVIGCFSIGLGAALTPLGEPLSTIAIAKLRGEPFNAGFFFLLKNLGLYIIPGILFMGVLGAGAVPSVKSKVARDSLKGKAVMNLNDVFLCSGKVYFFIMALVLLGEGFKPIVNRYIVTLPAAPLYWINSLSAVMDNATLAAAEISPKMSLVQIQYILMGLLLAGGMLIPGNIPNIISAGRLNISSREWAKHGVPLGLMLMIIYFVIFEVMRRSS